MDVSIEIIHARLMDSTGVCTDTRAIAEGNLFIALKGDRFDGNRFAFQALEKGCRFAIVDDPSLSADPRIISVHDTLDTLQRLAHYHRKQYHMPVLAITGTNGKTTTKELCHEILKTKFNTIATEGNLNNHIGVPLTLLRITGDTEFAIVEMGANHPGEIGTLCKIAEPTHGIITNIGKAHLEGFGGYEGVKRTKSELFDFLRHNNGQCFVNEDDPVLMALCHDLPSITYGTNAHDVQGKCMDRDSYFLRFEWDDGGRKHNVQTQLAGDYNLFNVLAAIAVGQHFQVPPGAINEALSKYVPRNNRSQVIRTPYNDIILDAYNANPTSMNEALKSLNKMKADRKMVILGDMMELGEDAASEHAKVVDLVKQYGLDQALFIGEHFADPAGKSGFPSVLSARDALTEIQNQPPRDTLILLKGSRKMELEQLVAAL